MQIGLTKHLADTMGIKPAPAHENENSLFSWTANWTKVWDNRRAKDMIVLVNNATRFTVAIYQAKRKDLKNVAEIMRTAISNTLLFMNPNPDLVEEYMRLAGEVEFTQNHSRQKAAWVTGAGQKCAFHVAGNYNGIATMFSDTVGATVNHHPVKNSSNIYELPYQTMINALSKLTGKQAYKYRAFELQVTLDLGIYKAVRRIIVPANLELVSFHKVLQSVFGWQDYHLYDFTIFDGKERTLVARIVPFEDTLDFDKDAVFIKGHTLSEFFPERKHMTYTYDMGDYWEHEIRLVRVIKDHGKESPYLLEASGQTPPEDVGGVWGFLNFCEIMSNPEHPEYEEMKEWSRYWSPELGDLEQRPRIIYV
ncbi:MAG: plasmid pRiA4b ORF-3 family protein [Firmicutes bacterium]|nr:plasmid pRiA4b ORF-3 family protein [Bacillota bacterium]